MSYTELILLFGHYDTRENFFHQVLLEKWWKWPFKEGLEQSSCERQRLSGCTGVNKNALLQKAQPQHQYV